MFLSIRQVEESIEKLKSVHPFYGITFLVCKREGLPIGISIPFQISLKETVFLDEFYKPDGTSEYFYRVFRISDKRKNWVHRRKYASSTLQSIRTQTVFGKAFLHDPNSDKWGWDLNYVQILKANLSQNSPPFRNKPIPAFDLAVWLYHNRSWSTGTTENGIIETFLSEFQINPQEREAIFDLSVPKSLSGSRFQESPILWKELRAIVGHPPDSEPEEGATLRFLELKEIGPATKFRYEPSDRLNVITGDNSLGKTFILESIWWALTGEWIEYPALPRKDSKTKPKIIFSISTSGDHSQKFSADYNRARQTWENPTIRDARPGLVVYARIDGSFAVWDPAKALSVDKDAKYIKTPVHLFFKRRDVWNGLYVRDAYQNEQWLCNGLIRDLVTWQTGGERYKQHFDALVACLETLSPSDAESIRLGQQTRISLEDSREFPTLQMPYGDVPIVHASSGIQRITSLAYIMVWAWQEHLANSSIIRRKPQRRLVLLVDEVEAHLHPRWQRRIIPALMAAVSHLESSVSPQLHVATHSPMVMASAETVFNEDTDDLHHLKLVGHEVILEELPFIKRGRADQWLMSEVFGLQQPRSVPAEQAISDAKSLQLADVPSSDAVSEVNGRLIKYLAPDDDFWPRWRYFAKKHGVN